MRALEETANDITEPYGRTGGNPQCAHEGMVWVAQTPPEELDCPDHQAAKITLGGESNMIIRAA